MSDEETESEFNLDETQPLSGRPAKAEPSIWGLDQTVHLERTEKAKEGKQSFVNDFTRYQEFSNIGAGGTGSVDSCIDPNLGRTVALKVLKGNYRYDSEQRLRFIREAQIMSQIEHPNIMPIHELGQDKNENIYFTMKHVEGETLSEIISGLSVKDPDYIKKYSRTKLVDMFIDICNGMAYAHSNKIIHRDLKPANILIGAFGEVLVLDWGLAKVIQADESDVNMIGKDVLAAIDIGPDQFDLTMDGVISGTPIYMSPEQATGKLSSLDQRSDIYTLGCILYELITYEHTVKADSLVNIIQDIVKKDVPPPKKLKPENKIPCELSAICMKCLEKDPDKRYQTVLDLIADLQAHKEDRSITAFKEPLIWKFWKACKRHPVITATVATVIIVLALGSSHLAIANKIRYDKIMAMADNERQNGNLLYEEKINKTIELQRLHGQTISKEKSAEELALEDEIAKLHNDSENNYEIAFAFYMNAAGDNFDDRRYEALKEIFFNRIDYAILIKDYDHAQTLLDLIKLWQGKHGRDIPELVASEAKLKGTGSLSISSSFSGLKLTLMPLKEDSNGSLQTSKAQELGKLPIQDYQLEKGSYLIEIRSEEKNRSCIFPIFIGHSEVKEIVLPSVKEDYPGFAYIPEGAFLKAGIFARNERLHSKHLPAYYMKSTEVTFNEFLQYWLNITDPEIKAKDIPKVRFSRDEQFFTPAWDLEGDLIDKLDRSKPVVGINQDSAERYCQWLSQRDQRQYRLPSADEWEKAARGVDGRHFPWGNTFNSSFAYTLENGVALSEYGFTAKPGSFPMDKSVYGVYDMAGNVREWTASKFPNSPYFVIKGSSAALTKRFAYSEYSSDTPVVPSDVGFRYIIDLNIK